MLADPARGRQPLSRATDMGHDDSARFGRGKKMKFGASMFFTDYSMSSADLARALEERGFESVWAPEHSHIPVSRKSPWPGGAELPKMYYDAMDPFVTLTAAAMATKTLMIGTGVCLVNQRDPIQLAKQVASIDQISGGRFLFGIGIGWNEEEMENHGTVFESRAKLVRERIEAMKEIWTKSKAEYHGEFVNFDPVYAWPKPVQKPYPPIIVGGGFPQGARRALRYGNGWIPIGGRGPSGALKDLMPKLQKMADEAKRDLKEVPLSIFGAKEDLAELKAYAEIGAERAVVSLPAEKADTILPVLDRWAALMRHVNA
jgi:probable F420-dependent oxidoreductase